MFQACFSCNLLFELDRPPRHVVPCPKCGAALEDYQPEAEFEQDDSAELSAAMAQDDNFRGPVYDMTRMSRVIEEEGRTEMMSARDFHSMMEQIERSQGLEVPGDDEPTNLLPVDPQQLIDLVADKSEDGHGQTGPVPPRKKTPAGATGPVPPKRKSVAPQGSTGPVPSRPTGSTGVVPPRRTAQPATPRPAAAPAAQDVPDYGGAFGSYFDARAEDVAQPDAIDAIVGAKRAETRQAPPPPRRPRRRRRRVLLWVWLVLGVGFLGLIAYMVVSRTTADGTPEGPTAVAAPVAESSGLEKAIREASVSLPEIDGTTAPDDDPVYIVAGPEKLRMSAGPVPGLTSVSVPESLTKDDSMGTWIEALERALPPGDPDRQLVIALPADVRARTLTQFAYSGYRAGYRRFGLAVRRVRDGGGLGVLQFGLRVPEEPLPSAGAAELRLGRLGAYATVEGRDGDRISKGDGIVPRVSPGGPVDMAQLDERIAALTAAHPIVRLGIVRVAPTLDVGTLARIVKRMRYGDNRDRFTEIQLAQ